LCAAGIVGIHAGEDVESNTVKKTQGINFDLTHQVQKWQQPALKIRSAFEVF